MSHTMKLRERVIENLIAIFLWRQLMEKGREGAGHALDLSSNIARYCSANWFSLQHCKPGTLGLPAW